MPNSSPVVLVHGILGFGPKELGPIKYWGNAFEVPLPLERHEASVGPLSSAHDRACELAAQIRGEPVDYGPSHSEKAGHAQFHEDPRFDFTGRELVRDWSEDRPVHLVGHSLGSPTIRCLQNLLEEDFWGWGSNHRWVASISTISGVSNESPLVYRYGVDEETGLMKEAKARPLLKIIGTLIGAAGGALDAIYDFDLDHWGFERQKGESLDGYLDRIEDSSFSKGKDHAGYTRSLQGAYEDNARWRTFPGHLLLLLRHRANLQAAAGGLAAPEPVDELGDDGNLVVHRHQAVPPAADPAAGFRGRVVVGERRRHLGVFAAVSTDHRGASGRRRDR